MIVEKWSKSSILCTDSEIMLVARQYVLVRSELTFQNLGNGQIGVVVADEKDISSRFANFCCVGYKFW